MTTRFHAEQCQALIERFEAAPALHERKQAEGSYSFVQLSVSRHWPEVETQVARVMMTCLQQYWQAMEIGPYWPENRWPRKSASSVICPMGGTPFPRMWM